MTRAERRAWRSVVFGHCDLTLAQKLVLLALETSTDYPEGTNARPGAARIRRGLPSQCPRRGGSAGHRPTTQAHQTDQPSKPQAGSRSLLQTAFNLHGGAG